MVGTTLCNLRSQCMNHSIALLSLIWILDDRDSIQVLSSVNTCLTEYLMKDMVPGGFLSELLNRTALKPELFDRVIETFF